MRPRRPEDLPALLALLQRVHETEGYPVRAAAVSEEWLTGSHKPGLPRSPELGGWVAEDGGRLLGHVGLHPATGPCLPLWRAAVGEAVAVVSRFYTDRSVRGTGLALLGRASAEAAVRGAVPVLEVDPDSPSLGWYLRRGWREVGRAEQQWGHRLVDSVALVPPTAPGD